MLKPTHSLPPMLKASLACLLVKSVVYLKAAMQIPVFSVPVFFSEACLRLLDQKESKIVIGLLVER
jgi:hypothetical protein